MKQEVEDAAVMAAKTVRGAVKSPHCPTPRGLCELGSGIEGFRLGQIGLMLYWRPDERGCGLMLDEAPAAAPYAGARR